MRKIKIPKYSYSEGNTDVGISDNLLKPRGFRYSDKFLSSWYSEDLSNITGTHLILRNRNEWV